VDVVVATPGRLMAHMRETEAFTLQHLQYLVVRLNILTAVQ
jgi:superfamily II DNA/RNA helicase